MTHTDPGEQGHERTPTCPDTLDLFAPPPPTGPEAAPYTEDDGKPEAYLRWRDSDEGKHFFNYAIGAAIVALRDEGRRFSVLGYLHHYRMAFKHRVNNTYAPWIADDLVAARPELLDIIERRARRKEGPK